MERSIHSFYNDIDKFFCRKDPRGIFLKIKDATGGFYTAPSEKTVGDVYEGSSVSSFSSGGSSGDSTITVTSAPKNTFPGTKAGMVFNDLLDFAGCVISRNIANLAVWAHGKC